jgi:predicted  nucleic acid-binding Zn-ribbon protein
MSGGESMNDEEFQKLVLQELTGIKDKVAGIETRMGNMETRMDRIETRMGNIETRMDRIETRMGHMETRMGNMETGMDHVETRMGNMETGMDHMETRQDEIYQVVKAIEHSNQVGRAEMDSQNVRLAKVEGKLKKAAEVLSEDVEAAGI